MSSTTSSSPSGTLTSALGTSTSSGNSQGAFGGPASTSAPSSVLFFLALAVGVIIGLLFVFFTARYFVRISYGLHMYPLAGARTGPPSALYTGDFGNVDLDDHESSSGTGTGAASSAGAAGATATATSADGATAGAAATTERTPPTSSPTGLSPSTETSLRLPPRLSSPIVAVPIAGARFGDAPDLVERRLLLIHRSGRRFSPTQSGRILFARNRRPRRSRYSRMNRLTQAQVNDLFPEKTYHDWLNGGKERDMAITEGILEEEGRGKKKKAKLTAVTPESGSEEVGIEMTEIQVQPSHVSHETLHSALEPRPEELQFTSGSCAICLELIEEEDVVRGLVCGHVYHAACLDPWLTRRRACCPMCKRDYFMNDGENHEPEENDNVSLVAEETLTLEDCEPIRRDGAMRSVLLDLIAIDERVRLILIDQLLLQYRFEERALQSGQAKYGRFLKILWWKFMGISRRDLFNWALLKMYNALDAERMKNFVLDLPAPVVETTATTESADNSEVPTAVATNVPSTINENIPEPTLESPEIIIPESIARDVVEQRV